MAKSTATPPLVTKKTVTRPPKYHESPAFLRKESAFDVALGSCSSASHDKNRQQSLPPAPWHLGEGVSESHRLVATVARAVKIAALLTRPFSWGYGWKDGALAHNNTQRVADGVKAIAFFRHEIVRSISTGNRLSLFLTESGRVYQSGRLALKQDGCGMWAPRELIFDAAVDPAVTDTASQLKSRIVAIEAGHLVGYALDDLGRVYSWGTQENGQLGFEPAEQPTEIDSESPDEPNNNQKSNEEDTASEHSESDDDLDDDEKPNEPQSRIVVVERVPKLIPFFADFRIRKVSAGNHFALAISASGHVFSWGRSCDGQLGLGELTTAEEKRSFIATPRRIDALAHLIAVDVSAGDAHALGIFMSRSHIVDASRSWQPGSVDFKVVYSWGRGQNGRLGLGSSQNEPRPREARFFRGLNATQVAAGNDHSLVLCGVASQSFLYAFGGNRFGQLGIASLEDHIDMPSFVTEFANVRIASIGAGSRYSVALTGDGELFTWGDSTYGKTHRCDLRTTFVPWKMEESDESTTTTSSVKFHLTSKFVTQVSVGAHHSLGLFRIHGEMDRWRKFPLGPTASHLHPDEGINTSSLCICESSQSRTTSSFGVFVTCETCLLEPICRLCARQCHVNHLLKPVALGRREESQSCACGDSGRAQPPIQQQQAQSGSPENESEKKPAPTVSRMCAFTKLQPRIPEDDDDRKPMLRAKPTMPRQ